MSIELRAAQRFIDNKGVPPEKPKPRQKAWVTLLGWFPLPDEELDCRYICPTPPQAQLWPYETMIFTIDYPDRPATFHYCAQTADGKWVEILEPYEL